jgi:ribulose-5-phosphate 4-epimerase/fuculose-1-phosphate aldolase
VVFPEIDIERTRPSNIVPAEWKLRLELAATYRVFHARGWSEEIFNHITVRVPGAEPHYLINPFGLDYGEVTAHNLIKIDLEGNQVVPSPYPVNRAGFVIHSAIHAARADAHCVIHTHNTAGVAVSCKPQGITFDNFYAAFLFGNVGYHDFEGVTVHTGEQERLTRSLGANHCLVLRNHGLLVVGHNLAEAYYWNYVLQRACEVQVAAGCLPGANLTVPESALEVSVRDGPLADPENDLYRKLFSAAVRRAKVTLADLTAAGD